MKRTISSKFTLPTKVFALLLAILPITLVLINLFAGRISPVFPTGIIAIVIASAFMMFFIWYYSRFSFVSVDENNLYVSRWFKEVSVPLAEVEDVSLASAFGLVIIRLKPGSNAVSKIVFMPRVEKSAVFSRYQSHPIVDELKTLARKKGAS